MNHPLGKLCFGKSSPKLLGNGREYFAVEIAPLQQNLWRNHPQVQFLRNCPHIQNSDLLLLSLDNNFERFLP